jgi:hypothetical protein
LIRAARSVGAELFVIEEPIMSQITIHIHPELAEKLLADGVEGARAVAALSRQAIRLVQACGRRIAYAPVVLPDGTNCAMSARGGARGLVVEIDPPGAAIPGRGVVRERQPERNRGQTEPGPRLNNRRR